MRKANSSRKIDSGESAARDWARSGLMWLTGTEDSPPQQGPGCIPSCADGALQAIRKLIRKPLLAQTLGSTLLCERAALLDLNRRGSVSPNGSCRLLETKDGWIALNLARQDDWALMNAWLDSTQNINMLENDMCRWRQISAQVRLLETSFLLTRGRMLGIPVAESKLNTRPDPWYVLHKQGKFQPRLRHKSRVPLVVDLSSLWAGPLCSHLLQQAGARVIKIESISRPDGARQGSKAFYDLINADKQSVALNFSSDLGQRQLYDLINKADIVIEGSRPRALKHLHIDAEALVGSNPGLVWISINGYGRQYPQNEWVAFGDDAAVAAGVSAETGHPPIFCGDALADPLTGLHAALAALAFWSSGQGALLDISLCQTTAYCLHFELNAPRAKLIGEAPHWSLCYNDQVIAVHKPQARLPTKTAALLGEHTQKVLREFDIPC